MNLRNALPPVHPGEFLKEILDELGISQASFARAVGISSMRISHIIKGKRPVTAEMALLFGKAFGQTLNPSPLSRQKTCWFKVHSTCLHG